MRRQSKVVDLAIDGSRVLSPRRRWIPCALANNAQSGIPQQQRTITLDRHSGHGDEAGAGEQEQNSSPEVIVFRFLDLEDLVVRWRRSIVIPVWRWFWFGWLRRWRLSLILAISVPIVGITISVLPLIWLGVVVSVVLHRLHLVRVRRRCWRALLAVVLCGLAAVHFAEPGVVREGLELRARKSRSKRGGSRVESRRV